MKTCVRPFIVCKRGARDRRFSTLLDAQNFAKTTTGIYDVGDVYIVRCDKGKRIVVKSNPC